MKILQDFEPEQSKTYLRQRIKSGAVECIWPHYWETVKNEAYTIKEFDFPVLIRFGKRWTRIDQSEITRIQGEKTNGKSATVPIDPRPDHSQD